MSKQIYEWLAAMVMGVFFLLIQTVVGHLVLWAFDHSPADGVFLYSAAMVICYGAIFKLIADWYVGKGDDDGS